MLINSRKNKLWNINAILLGPRTNYYYNIDESHRHNAEEKNPDTRLCAV